MSPFAATIGTKPETAEPPAEGVAYLAVFVRT
jgi:hypothetical protein